MVLFELAWRYQYQITGENHISEKFQLVFKKATINKEGTESALNERPIGSMVTMFYNPENPGEAVLKTGKNGSGVNCIGIVLLFFAAVLIIFGIIISLSN